MIKIAQLPDLDDLIAPSLYLAEDYAEVCQAVSGGHDTGAIIPMPCDTALPFARWAW